MNTVWTMLLLTAIGGPLDGQIIGGGVYPSGQACKAAIEPIGDTLGVDYKSDCIATGAPSVSPRPKPRATVSR